MAKNYYIDLSRIEHLTDDFNEKHTAYQIVIAKNTKDIIQIKINKSGDKKASSLNIYKKDGGHVSYNIQGNNADYNAVCQQCFEYIESNANYGIVNVKDIQIDNVDPNNFLVIIDCLKDFKYHIEDKAINGSHIKNSYIIHGTNKDSITIHLYTNNKVHVQGRISPIFVFFLFNIAPLFGGSEYKELFSLQEAKHNFIEKDITKHIPIGLEKISPVGQTLINSSLLSINQPIVMPEYSMYVFPIFKVLEALLIERVTIEMGDFDDFGDVFTYNCSTKKHELKKGSTLFTEKKECDSLVAAYNLFCTQRHSLFHGKYPMELTRILTLDESIDLSKECLKCIRDLCAHCNWN